MLSPGVLAADCERQFAQPLHLDQIRHGFREGHTDTAIGDNHPVQVHCARYPGHGCRPIEI